VACHVWAREEDSVAESPILHRKDCLGNWFSSTQFITREAFTHFQNTLLDVMNLVKNTPVRLSNFSRAVKALRFASFPSLAFHANFWLLAVLSKAN
jgi:hypothetical protein